ncbi:hypothetical protein SAMN04487983_1010172 [Streptomyces sp. yr375]|uniref:hypothetical protein n=1 Tax=Streptomyces sp. yr375 TaxID=1761906 RepID=UPI0008BDEF22|nr:hypothetical protein [Streptomyces sp. yr375]SER03554.1 hypothetical protein SAMN04487983_1010172 [Streptomyces sp. yr375]
MPVQSARSAESVLSLRRAAAGVGAAAVLAATGTWVLWPAAVDARLWGEIRPVIEARIAADSQDSGSGESGSALDARWFCRAEPLELAAHAGEVRAGVNTLCVGYGVRDGGLVECGAGQFPQVVRLQRDDAADGGYRVVSREEPPDGAGYTPWTHAHFGVYVRSALQEPMSSAALETAARAHFGLPADASVGEC